VLWSFLVFSQIQISDLKATTHDCTSQGLESVIVKQGDTLQKISQDKYQTTRRWKHLFQLNQERFESPNDLKIGDIVCVPGLTGSPDAQDTLTRSSDPHVTPQPGETTQNEYVIQKGDSLSKISKAYFGAYKYWGVIFESNLDRLKNPNHLSIGHKIVIPTQALLALVKKTIDSNEQNRGIASETKKITRSKNKKNHILGADTETETRSQVSIGSNTDLSVTETSDPSKNSDIEPINDKVSLNKDAKKNKKSEQNYVYAQKNDGILEREPQSQKEKAQENPKNAIEQKQLPAVQLNSYTDWEVSL